MKTARRTAFHHYAIAVAIWLLAIVYAESNLLPLQLFVDITAVPPDTGTVFWAADGNWAGAQTQTQPLVREWNRAIYAFPTGLLGSHVLLAPRGRLTPYHIDAIRWQRSGLFADVPVDHLVEEQEPAGHKTPAEAGDRLFASGVEAPPRLVVPTPGLGFSIASLALAAVLPILGLLLLLFSWRRGLDPVRFAAVMLAGIMACYGFVLLRLGPTLPLYDDWRYVLEGSCNIVDGGWAWLGCVANDTYYLTNQLLDAVVLHLSNVDFFWVRLLALALLGLQIVVQFRILRAVATGRPATTAIGIALIVWSLGAGAYWGTTAIAYQQALPTLCGTLCLALIIDESRQPKARVTIGLLLLFATASGLAYISGGLLLLSLSMALILASRCGPHREANPAARAGWILLGAGVILLATQLVLVSSHQGSLIDHTHGSKSVFPNDKRFWIFFMGLFGRALGYAGSSNLVDALLAILILAPGAILATLCLTKHREMLNRSWGTLAIYAAAGSATYAAIVAFGRAGFIAADAGADAITAFGKSRFHYWPVAAMVPYAWLGWTQIALLVPRGARALQVLVAMVLLMPKSLSTFDQKPALYISDYMAAAGAQCVATHRKTIDLAQPLICPVMTGGEQDIAPTLRRLRDRGSPTFRTLMQFDAQQDELQRNGFDATP